MITRDCPVYRNYLQIISPIPFYIWINDKYEEKVYMPSNGYTYDCRKLLLKDTMPNQPAYTLHIEYNETELLEGEQVILNSFDTNFSDVMTKFSGEVVQLNDEQGTWLHNITGDVSNINTSVENIDTNLEGIKIDIGSIKINTDLLKNDTWLTDYITQDCIVSGFMLINFSSTQKVFINETEISLLEGERMMIVFNDCLFRVVGGSTYFVQIFGDVSMFNTLSVNPSKVYTGKGLFTKFNASNYVSDVKFKYKIKNIY